MTRKIFDMKACRLQKKKSFLDNQNRKKNFVF